MKITLLEGALILGSFHGGSVTVPEFWNGVCNSAEGNEEREKLFERATNIGVFNVIHEREEVSALQAVFTELSDVLSQDRLIAYKPYFDDFAKSFFADEMFMYKEDLIPFSNFENGSWERLLEKLSCEDEQNIDFNLAELEERIITKLHLSEIPSTEDSLRHTLWQVMCKFRESELLKK